MLLLPFKKCYPRAGHMAQVIENLLNNCKCLSSNPGTAKKRKRMLFHYSHITSNNIATVKPVYFMNRWDCLGLELDNSTA
jgi:hypothetical protein